MSKYDFELDMIGHNSNSVILRAIAPGSKVLELGCAHGRMTKYMKESLNCEIDTIEIDEEAGKIAAHWARKSFAGDLEDKSIWDELPNLDCSNYDYIVFADVLEHLKNPEKVLRYSKKLLSPNGSIWISIPNVGHNSIIIDLLNNKFIYRSLGLLDNTHLKLFTEPTLQCMVDSCALTVVSKINLNVPVEHTEFCNNYSEIPIGVASFLKQREFGEVYQFVWELKNDN